MLSAVPLFPADWAARIEAAFPEGVVAILAGSLLFLVPCGPDRRPALGWDEAIRIDWGTILLFGGGLALGSLAFRTGLSDAIAGLFLGGGEPPPLWLLALIALFVANSMTELMSNTATANLLLPLAFALGVRGTPALQRAQERTGARSASVRHGARPAHVTRYPFRAARRSQPPAKSNATVVCRSAREASAVCENTSSSV